MSGIIRAMAEIGMLCRQADVHGQPRVSITFARSDDRERFKAEIKRQVEANEIAMFVSSPLDRSEATIHGIKVRII